MKNIIKNTGGFSLVEVIAAIAITSMLALGALAMNDATNKRKKYETYQADIETILTYLRYARSDAISNRVIGSSVPDGGFGTYIEYFPTENEMQLTYFVDNDDDAGSGTEDGQFSPDYDTILDQRTIRTFWSFAIENHTGSAPAPTNTISTIFLPPNAEMVINDGTAGNDYRSVDLAFDFSRQKKRICLNRVSRFFEITTGDSCN